MSVGLDASDVPRRFSPRSSEKGRRTFAALLLGCFMGKPFVVVYVSATQQLLFNFPEIIADAGNLLPNAYVCLRLRKNVRQ